MPTRNLCPNLPRPFCAEGQHLGLATPYVVQLAHSTEGDNRRCFSLDRPVADVDHAAQHGAGAALHDSDRAQRQLPAAVLLYCRTSLEHVDHESRVRSGVSFRSRSAIRRNSAQRRAAPSHGSDRRRDLPHQSCAHALSYKVSRLPCGQGRRGEPGHLLRRYTAHGGLL